MGEEEKKEKKKKSKKKAEAGSEPPPPEAAEAAPPAPAPEGEAPPPAEAAEPAPAPAAEPATTAEETPAPAPPPADTPAPTKKKRAGKSLSNIFAMFTQHQVQEFKEAFGFIDQDKDGFISKSDLLLTFDSLGREVDDEDLDSMVNEAPGPINFTMFLTIFGERIAGADDESLIRRCFAAIFDEDSEGKMKEEDLRAALLYRGDKFSEEEVKEVLSDAPVDVDGNINIRKFTRIITKGEDDMEPASSG